MADRIAERVEALGLPWFSRTMRIGTLLFAVVLFVFQLLNPPSGGPVAVAGKLVAGAVMSVVSAAVITTYLKIGTLVVRVPLSLYLYP